MRRIQGTVIQVSRDELTIVNQSGKKKYFKNTYLFDQVNFQHDVFISDDAFIIPNRQFLVQPTSDDDHLTKIIQHVANKIGSTKITTLNQLRGVLRKGVSSLAEIDQLSIDRKSFSDEAGKFMKEWYEHRIKRKIKLLGIKSKQIPECSLNFDWILIKTAQANPFHCHLLDTKQAINLAELFSINYTPTDLIYHRLARELHRTISGEASSSEKKTYFGRGELIKIGIDPERLPDLDGTQLSKFHLVSYNIESDEREEIFTLSCSDKIEAYLAEEFFERSRREIPAGSRLDLTNEANFEIKKYIHLITGKAGTGKTTLIKKMVEQCLERRIDFLLASHTGKAVQRMKEVTGVDKCYTLHHLILSNAYYPFYVIIDEASMIDDYLMYQFLHVYPNTPIILIGDYHQLPPINFGRFFQQMVKLEDIFSVKTLREQHRGNKGILQAANKVLAGKMFRPNGEVTLFQSNIVDLITSKKIPKDKYKIIVPTNKLKVEFNEKLQRFYHGGSKDYIEIKKRCFYLGDPVMHQKNLYEWEGNERKLVLTNGEEGKIKKIVREPFPGIAVKYEERTQFYMAVPAYIDKIKENLGGMWYNIDQLSFEEHPPKNYFTSNKYKICSSWKEKLDHVVYYLDENATNINDVEVAYAITVHKSQGSEWDIVIVYVRNQCYEFIKREMIYTAVTRAKEKLYCGGNEKVWPECIQLKLSPPQETFALHLAELNILNPIKKALSQLNI